MSDAMPLIKVSSVRKDFENCKPLWLRCCSSFWWSWFFCWSFSSSLFFCPYGFYGFYAILCFSLLFGL